ncbi:MAG TPA: alpha/beta hydrolase [Candidatus Dormibacteraeota bacterium]|nr:alpha/beta hydrolase [Candidatus Dormibacteraeota bacterium]
MWRRRLWQAALAASAVAGGGAAAVAAHLAARRRAVRWTAAGRRRSQPYLSVQTIGTGNDPVVLLHPLSGSADYFGSAFDELGEPGPLVVPDLLGYGASPRPEHGYGPDQQVAAVVASLDQLGIEVPALWVGHGLGAVLALRAAATHPERVRAVVAISPLLYRDSAAASRHLRRLTPLELGGPLDRNLASAIYGGPGARPRLAGQVARLWQVDLPGAEPTAPRPPTATAYRETLDECVLRADGWRWFDQMTAPVHIVLPAKDRVPDPELLSELAARHANVSLSVLPFGDHRLPLTHPDGCLAAIDRFRPPSQLP